MRKINGKSNLCGGYLKQKRLDKNLNRSDLARELQLLGLNMTVDDIYRIETNRILLKDFELIVMSIALDIDLNELKEIIKSDKSLALTS